MIKNLKEMRLSLDISIEKVCEDLNIRQEYIRALEDNVQSFIPDVYLKGYEKMYHKYLNSKLNSNRS